MKPFRPQSAQALSQDEQRWLEAFRKMDDECRRDNLIAMEGQARRYPRHVKPTLRLVVGGDK